MADFRSQDFKEILFPVHTLTMSMNLFETYPNLYDFDEFMEVLPPEIPIAKVFKYIVYVYDKKSPFYTQIDDLIDRKKQAALEVDFKLTEDGEFTEEVKAVLNCKNKRVNAMILRYCRIQGKEFTNIVASNEAFYQLNLKLLSNHPDDGDSKSKAALDNDVTNMAKRLSEKARDFLSQETAKGLEEDLWILAEDEAANINISPEDHAT
jgi:hypothetical protein